MFTFEVEKKYATLPRNSVQEDSFSVVFYTNPDLETQHDCLVV